MNKMKLTEANYVDCAENVIDELSQLKNQKGKKIPIVTTSKIRNLLAMTVSIYNDILSEKSEKLSSDIIGRIRYLKVRFIYEAGREAGVKNLVEKGHILKYLDEIGDSRQSYILFSRYMEALVAFRKFKGGRDE